LDLVFCTPLISTLRAVFSSSIIPRVADRYFSAAFRSARLIGYQIIFGCGVGGALQNTVGSTTYVGDLGYSSYFVLFHQIIAIQAEYNDEEHKIPQSTSLTNFTQLTGGIIGIA
jgi:hypothetical protein